LEEDLLVVEGEEELEEPEAPKDPVPHATIDLLKKKKRNTKTISVVVTDEDGEPIEVSLTFRGVSAKEYDKIIAKHPPRPKDKKEGYAYNPDSFGPEIISKTCINPEMTIEDANEIWESDDWNRGERFQLLMAAIEVCTFGLNVPFKKRVSE
jgi:hypothetical protein